MLLAQKSHLIAGSKLSFGNVSSYSINNDRVVIEVDEISNSHLLALAIITSDGGGCYVFAPLSSQTHIVNELKTHLNN